MTAPLLPPPPLAGPPPDRAAKARLRSEAIGQASLTALGLGAGILALRAVDVSLPPCPFRAVTGVPCPGCGMTRLADAVAHGHLTTAVTADAAGVAILAAIVVLAVVYGVVALKRRRGTPAELPGWMRAAALPIALGALVAIHWATTIVTGGLPSS